MRVFLPYLDYKGEWCVCCMDTRNLKMFSGSSCGQTQEEIFQVEKYRVNNPALLR